MKHNFAWCCQLIRLTRVRDNKIQLSKLFYFTYQECHDNLFQNYRFLPFELKRVEKNYLPIFVLLHGILRLLLNYHSEVKR
jgi:hypothetical protein